MDEEKMLAFQDFYPEDYSHCFGCGRLNEKGHQIKSYWDGEESVCHFKPPLLYSGGYWDMKNLIGLSQQLRYICRENHGTIELCLWGEYLEGAYLDKCSDYYVFG